MKTTKIIQNRKALFLKYEQVIGIIVYMMLALTIVNKSGIASNAGNPAFSQNYNLGGKVITVKFDHYPLFADKDNTLQIYCEDQNVLKNVNCKVNAVIRKVNETNKKSVFTINPKSNKNLRLQISLNTENIQIPLEVENLK